ncbi:uncharacterized protein BJ212DRAFT_1299271 [Suillus subaureus]|uniref:Uncharacterized protein n=1 Tax=Suillus subaureus TaxID=48587 RepID=A0A9P7ECH5_9AGAM|nr:uncharacterized protein BJ212DRAFT_1299271 [Suillus subaureus]KAG1817098.1 hypothetical protein BJ212DRAFT_1299271 [Suillus subaureus]
MNALNMQGGLRRKISATSRYNYQNTNGYCDGYCTRSGDNWVKRDVGTVTGSASHHHATPRQGVRTAALDGVVAPHESVSFERGQAVEEGVAEFVESPEDGDRSVGLSEDAFHWVSAQGLCRTMPNSLKMRVANVFHTGLLGAQCIHSTYSEGDSALSPISKFGGGVCLVND